MTTGEKPAAGETRTAAEQRDYYADLWRKSEAVVATREALLDRWKTVTDYARGAEGSGPGDLQAYIESLWAERAERIAELKAMAYAAGVAAGNERTRAERLTQALRRITNFCQNSNPTYKVRIDQVVRESRAALADAPPAGEITSLEP